jgi:hypothetical protein
MLIGRAMLVNRLFAEVDLVFRTASDGGRRGPTPTLSGLGYRPHIVIGDPMQKDAILGRDGVVAERYLGAAFDDGPANAPVGELVRTRMMLVYWPDLGYEEVVPGASFTLREGRRIVGHGCIVRKWIEGRESPRGAILG